MAKIISLPSREHHSATIHQPAEMEELITWVSEMSNILQLIEQSLEKTPTYASKDFNSRR
jgi:hypothetical protein